jgi:F-type H+-transporting ATPase subunit gamma
MEQLEAIAHRIATIEGIAGVARTMKTLSAVNIPTCEAATESISQFHETVLDGMGVVLRSITERASPQPKSPVEQADTLLIVLGSDHGLCGGFNEAVADEAAVRLGVSLEADANANPASGAARASQVDTGVIAVGYRAASALSERGIDVRTTFRSASSPEGLRGMAEDLLVAIDTEISTMGEAGRVALIYNERDAHGRNEVRHWLLTPLDRAFLASIRARPWVSRGLPIHQVDVRGLFGALVRQHLFVSLFRAGALSLAAEHAARLSLMTQAEQALEQRLEEATAAFRRARQAGITDELLDIVGGFEAVSRTDQTAGETGGSKY